MKGKFKKTNSERFKHLPPFKGLLYFTGIDDCIIYYNDKIIGKGSILRSSGKRFRCLWNSPEQKEYAGILHRKMGRFGVRGYRQEDYIYITSIYHPPSRSTQAKRLHKIREIASHEKEIRENLNQNFTGYQRSHENDVLPALKNIKVKLGKNSKDEDFELAPIKRKRAEKREKTDFELEALKEKRISELEAFYIVRKFLDSTSLRLELIKLHFSVADIEAARNLIDTSALYMSARAYDKR